MDNICTAIQSILQTALGSSYTIIYGDDVPGMSQFPYCVVKKYRMEVVVMLQ